MRRALVLGAALAALALAGCGSGGGKHAATGTGKGGLTDVTSAAQFVNLFNQASGEPRLVVLVSPT
ncbi:MAG TPA: hypothetical protein VFJ91_08275 [Gaiellaceae bacterium]|nr:hypothetical protein [Gaiellaceae bacterium]